MSNVSLTSLMNDMVGRLDDILPEDEKRTAIPEERYWDKIGSYIEVDPVLAQLYQQYGEAKNRLGTLLAGDDAGGPMAEVTWDMHDSLRGAIETRLIELENTPSLREKAEAIQESMREQAREERAKRFAERQENSMENIVNFLIWTVLVFNNRTKRMELADDFGQAC